MEKERRALRDQRDQLLTLLNGWDPAGRLAAGERRDQYEYLVDKLLDVLSRNASKEEVSEFLETEIRSHFTTAPAGAGQFAAKAVTWFQMISAEE